MEFIISIFVSETLPEQEKNADSDQTAPKEKSYWNIHFALRLLCSDIWGEYGTSNYL